MVATATPANASLISQRSTSSAPTPWRSRRRSRGLGGAQVQARVRSATTALPTISTSGSRPLLCRGRGGEDARGGAVGELRGVAGVIVPSAGGRSEPRLRAVVGRMPSSRPSSRPLTGTISSRRLACRRGGPGVRRGRERVLVGAGDVEPGVLGVGQLDHPGVLDRAIQAVVHHHVDHRLVAHRRGAADVDGVRGAGHRVEAADHRAGRLALADHARRQRHGAEAGQADVVDRDARHCAPTPPASAARRPGF